jgi:hypothetical protein
MMADAMAAAMASGGTRALKHVAIAARTPLAGRLPSFAATC